MTHIDFQEMMLQHKVWVRIGLLRMLVAYQGMICNDKGYTRYRIPSEIRCGKKQAERVVVQVEKIEARPI